MDRIIGVATDEPQISISLHKDVQYRDERIQVLQNEIEHLRKAHDEMAKQVKRSKEAFLAVSLSPSVFVQASNKQTTLTSLMSGDDLKEQVRISFEIELRERESLSLSECCSFEKSG